MKWTSCSTHALTNGRYKICRCFTRGVARYELWDGMKFVKFADTSQELKDYVEALR